MKNPDLYFSSPEYLMALNFFREKIANGERLVFYDSTAIGDKHTHCTWGLCSVSPASWPEKLVKSIVGGKAYTKYHDNHQHCPLSKKNVADKDSWGCYYHCRVFGGEIRENDREKVLDMYGKRIRDYVAFIAGEPKEKHDPAGDVTVDPVATESNEANKYVAMVALVGFLVFALAMIALLS